MPQCIPSQRKAEKKAINRDMQRLEAEIQKETQTKPSVQKPEATARKTEINAVIKQYESYLETPGSTQVERSQVMRRLADLYLEMEREKFLTDMEKYERILAKGKTPKTGPPVQNFRKSIRMYENLLKNQPDIADRDHIYYQLASSYDQMGDLQKSVVFLIKLSHEYPKSRYLLEVHFRLGENYFDRNEFEKAKFHYRKGLEFEGDKLYSLNSLYKLGWSQFLMEQFFAAADTFRILLDRELEENKDYDLAQIPSPQKPRIQPLGQDLKRQGLWGDALRMMARCFSEMSDIEELEKYFQKIGDRSYRGNVYQAIAEDLIEQERVTEAIQVYEIYLKGFSLEPQVVDVYTSIISAYDRIGNAKQATHYRKILISYFKPTKSWYQANALEARQRSIDLRRKSISELATYYHHLAQKEKDAVSREKTYSMAISWYLSFLKEFSNDENVDEMRFLAAECYFAIQSFEESGKYYDMVLSRHKDDKRRIQAAINAFESYHAKFLQEKKTQRREKTSETLKNLRQSRKSFEKLSDEKEKNINFLLREGNAFYELEEYSQCRPPLEQLVQRYENTQSAFTASRLLALSYFKTQDYEKSAQILTQTIRLSQSLLQNNSIKISEKDVKDVHELRASAMFKEAQVLEKKKGIHEAKKAYFRVFEDEADSLMAPDALYQAAQGYLAGNSTESGEKGVELFHRLARTFPRHSSVPSGLLEAANWQKKRGFHQKAAADYQWAALASQKAVDKKSALYAAGLEWFLAQEDSKSIVVWNQLLQNSTITQDDRVEYYYRLGMAQLNLGKNAEGLMSLGHSIRVNSNRLDGGGAYYACRAEYAIGEYYEKSYLKVSLVKPLKKNLEKKQKLLTKTIKSYANAVEYRDVEISTKANFKIGFVLENFALSLKESPTPPGLNSDEKQQYRILMEEKAFPFEEKAIAAYEANIRNARESNIYNEWVTKSFHQLGSLIPARYGKMEIDPKPVAGGPFF